MATRRPPTRTRQNTNTMPPPSSTGSSRPQSAMARSNSSLKSAAADSRSDLAQVAGPSRATRPGDDAEHSIRVVIRCRRRSEREVSDNSPIIVSSSGARSEAVTIECAAPVSSLGLVTLAPTRTYPFDTVFGPEADQAMIYHDVVSPMLEEVVQGYNCTLFAYGQTGTGKTYTMQGDLTPTPMGNPSANAGMIPRVLFRLFHKLETSGADYSVRVSFVELYNEELRDLLAVDLAPPTSSTQPMGQAGKGAAPPDNGLRIFEDATKRGVFIQGLEDIPCRTSADALALLTRGSQRRQIAATKFNDHSSRSHSVFSITVHVKETSNIGDDLLKIGKLNLVDLAGSENIGRSGAENKRAREAGMINQSLLTLGRVINALVEKASHVPYRESKLTRLLQDSLGGRTKTCLIATISPARSNMEETLSTLDYAIKAKSIQNKPEMNQRMTRNALLKEYIGEIERLKADVLAAREKNGIFFSEETWREMSAAHELRETECQEAKKQVDIIESQLRSVREDFEQSIGLLMKRDGELKETREHLKNREEELQVTESQLRVVKGALEEEVVVRKAHQKTETTLDGVAGGLRGVAKESIGDLGKVFSKLDRKTSVFSSNSKAVLKHGKSIASDAGDLSTKLEQFIKSSTQSTAKLRKEAAQYQARELEALAGHSSRIDKQLQRMQDALKLIHEKEDAGAESLGAIQTAVKETHDSIKNGFGTWSDSLKVTCEASCKELQTSSSSNLETVEKMLKTLGNLAEAIVRESHGFVEAELRRALEAKALAESAASAEIVRLRSQNARLESLLESQRVRGERANDELVQRVSGLLGEFTAASDRELRAAVAEVQNDNEEAEAAMQTFEHAHGKAIEGMMSSGKQHAAFLEKKGGERKRTSDGALKALALAKATLNEGLDGVNKSVSSSITTYSADIRKQTQTMAANCSRAFEGHGRVKRARLDATNTMATEAHSEFRSLHRSLGSMSRSVDAIAGSISSESDALSNTTGAYHSAARQGISSLEHATVSLLDEGTREDAPTGTTPRKRVWQYIDQWELTKNRDQIVKTWREGGGSKVGEETFVAEHAPLPEDDEMLDDEEVEEALRSPASPRSLPPIQPPPTDEHVISPAESPLAVSMSSSEASENYVPPTRPPPARKQMSTSSSLKSGLPTLGTLADRANVLGRGSRRGR